MYITYAKLRESVVKKVQKTYKGGQDVSKSLEELQPIDTQTEEPTRVLSIKSTPVE